MQIETATPSAARQPNALTAFINRYATPLTMGMFFIQAVSGVALFFHLTPNLFKEMHTWFGISLLLPVGLHLWKNWKSVTNYVRKHALLLPVAASLLAAVPFAVVGVTGGRGGNPAFQTMALMTEARLSDLAPVLKTTPDALLATLKQQGYQVIAPSETLAAVAEASGKQPRQLLFAIMPR